MNLASREIETKLADMKKSYLELLKVELPNWNKMTHTELANNYLESTDDDFRGICFIALLIKNWGIMVNFREKLYSSRITVEDCYDLLVDTINKALKYKAWTINDSTLNKSNDGAKYAISKCASGVLVNYLLATKNNNRAANYYNIVSIDEQVEKLGNACECMQLVADNTLLRMTLLIKDVMRHNIDCGILLDAICYQDVMTGNSLSKVSKTLVVKYLRELKEEDSAYYSMSYDIDEKIIKEHIRRITSKQGNKLTKYVNELMTIAKTNKEVIQLCL